MPSSSVPLGQRQVLADSRVALRNATDNITRVRLLMINAHGDQRGHPHAETVANSHGAHYGTKSPHAT